MPVHVIRSLQHACSGLPPGPQHQQQSVVCTHRPTAAGRIRRSTAPTNGNDCCFTCTSDKCIVALWNGVENEKSLVQRYLRQIVGYARYDALTLSLWGRLAALQNLCVALIDVEVIPGSPSEGCLSAKALRALGCAQPLTSALRADTRKVRWPKQIMCFRLIYWRRSL